MSIQSQGSFLGRLSFGVLDFIARAGIARQAANHVLGNNLKEKVAECANVALSQVDAEFPHQRWEGGEPVSPLFGLPLQLLQTCRVICKTAPEAAKEMELIQNTVECVEGISKAKLGADVCFRTCGDFVSVLSGLTLVSAIDTIVSDQLEQIIPSNSSRAVALKVAIGGGIGLVAAGGIVPLVAGITATEAVSVYGLSRGCYEIITKVFLRSQTPDAANAQGDAVEGGRQPEAQGAQAGARTIQPLKKRRAR